MIFYCNKILLNDCEFYTFYQNDFIVICNVIQFNFKKGPILHVVGRSLIMKSVKFKHSTSSCF